MVHDLGPAFSDDPLLFRPIMYITLYHTNESIERKHSQQSTHSY